MKILIKNDRDIFHTITRINGMALELKPNGYTVLDVSNEEFSFWTNLNKSVLLECGISVYSNESDIKKVMSETNELEQEYVIDEENFYTEDQLLSMSKEDLFNLCDDLNIKYRKNNSVKTLVKLLLDVIK